MHRLTKFFQTESSGGMLMIITALLSLVVANGTTADWYHAVIDTTLSHWVKDGLMVFFFLLVGMELKREMLDGFLTDRKQILLPLLAAVGGMLAPAVIFFLVNFNYPENWHGWAVSSATDIAFAICILTLAGKNIPPALKIFLLAIAIFDDLGAILVIAFFYSSGFALVPFLLVLASVAALFILNRLQVMQVLAYLLIGVALCFFLYESGIHTTIGGVIVGMAIPLRNPKDEKHSPLNKLMDNLHPWVDFCILPLFAFTAAGVNLDGMSFSSLFDPLVLGIALGLFMGKQIGIFATTWLVVKSGLSQLPEGTNWRQIHSVSIIAGIGFTMSLFIGVLAFKDASMQDQVKLGVLAGTSLSMIFGAISLRCCKAS